MKISEMYEKLLVGENKVSSCNQEGRPTVQSQVFNPETKCQDAEPVSHRDGPSVFAKQYIARPHWEPQRNPQGAGLKNLQILENSESRTAAPYSMKLRIEEEAKVRRWCILATYLF